jgi:hypothetical protein
MELGLDTVKDLLDVLGVLLVPVAVGVFAALWPTLAARQRRTNFEALIRRELEEAAPHVPGVNAPQICAALSAPNSGHVDSDKPWHAHLTRRLLHEEVIAHPVDNTEFVLSLRPELSYHLSQMWIEFGKARKESEDGGTPSQEHAEQFCWHLEQTCRFLDKRHGSDLRAQVWDPWACVVKSKYPDAKVESPPGR